MPRAYMLSIFGTAIKGRRLGLPRTNNHVEGWHRGFESLFDGAHVGILKLINALKIEYSITDIP